MLNAIQLGQAPNQIEVGDHIPVGLKLPAGVDEGPPTDIAAEALMAEAMARAAVEMANVQPNICPVHGSFIDSIGINWWYLSANTADFRADMLASIGMAGYNGLDIANPTEADRYIYDSIDNGGTEPAMGGIAEMFANAVGIDSDGRYSPPWSIAEFTAGTGTSGTNVAGFYRQIKTTNLCKHYGVKGCIALAAIVQPVEHDLVIPIGTKNDDQQKLFVNGEQKYSGVHDTVNAGYYHVTAGSVVHVCHTFDSHGLASGYSAKAFLWMLKQGSRLRVARVRVGAGPIELRNHHVLTRSVAQ